mmetsp:Transcript_21669/g.30372  ORF Transcript_21669/g.30372 Transcript_21669/m.30372 type:complete len:604 (-) Transcript_21669:63-1874(-)
MYQLELCCIRNLKSILNAPRRISGLRWVFVLSVAVLCICRYYLSHGYFEYGAATIDEKYGSRSNHIDKKQSYFRQDDLTHLKGSDDVADDDADGEDDKEEEDDDKVDDDENEIDKGNEYNHDDDDEVDYDENESDKEDKVNHDDDYEVDIQSLEIDRFYDGIADDADDNNGEEDREVEDEDQVGYDENEYKAGIDIQENVNFSEYRVGIKDINRIFDHEEKGENIDDILSHQYDVCVVGAGLSGSVIAERYASVMRKSVLVIDKRDHIGGNCYDYVDDETGILVSKYGAHLFHTNSKRVWEYVQGFSNFSQYEHKVQALIDDKYVPIPVNIDTVNTLFDLNITNSREMDKWLEEEQEQFDHEVANSEEMALSRVGKRLYDLIFKPYTIKQWAKDASELGPEVTARIPVRNDHNNKYFPDDTYQALPTNGYTKMFENILNHTLISVLTKTNYFEIKDKMNCKKLYYSGPIDAYFSDLKWPKLEYRSLEFERKVEFNKEFFQPSFVINHPSLSANYTRIVEYKHLLNQKSPHTIYFIERSNDFGEPYYPVPNEENKALYKQYQAMANNATNVTFVGRLANYKYFNMDEAILNALVLFDEDTNQDI